MKLALVWNIKNPQDEINPNNKIFEDYLILHNSLSELINLSDNDFLNVFQKTFSPMVQIAENMGFKYWQNLFRG